MITNDLTKDLLINTNFTIDEVMTTFDNDTLTKFYELTEPITKALISDVEKVTSLKVKALMINDIENCINNRNVLIVAMKFKLQKYEFSLN